MSERGISFRATRAYVTDAMNDSPAIDTEHTNAAWVAGATLDNGLVLAVPAGLVTLTGSHGWTTRDRSAGLDPRLAGLWSAENAEDTLVVGVGASGAYNIRFAAGDPSNAFAGALSWQVIDSDDVTVLATIAGNPAGGVIDATGTAYSASLWPANNTRISVTLSGTHFTIKSHGGAYALNYLSAELVAPAPTAAIFEYYRRYL